MTDIKTKWEIIFKKAEKDIEAKDFEAMLNGNSTSITFTLDEVNEVLELIKYSDWSDGDEAIST